MKQHIPTEIQELINDYVSGKLNEKQTDELWALFLEHPKYLEYLKTVKALHSIAADETKATPVYKLTYLRYIAAAAVFLILGFSSLVYFSSPSETDIPSFAALNNIELDIVRSANQESELNHILQTAITHSVNGEYDTAIRLLNEVIESPESSQQQHEAIMLQGIINYNLNLFDEALISFNKVIQKENVNPLILEQAYWYAANAYNHLGKVEQSVDYTQRVIALDGSFSRVAARKMQNLTE